VDPIVALALIVAVAAAVRGIWSPCGLSMLSSITPMTEAGRGNRFNVTAAWFVVGGIVGGITLGLLAAIGAAAVDLADPSDQLRWGIAAIAACFTAGIDLGAFGIDLPIFKRQVNDAWLRTYRSWVYGAGFGWQIGFGVATYIMTAGIFLTIVLAVLSASPAAAVAIGATFGLVRGLAVYVGRTGTSPAALGRIHERLDALAPVSRAAAAWTQVLAATVLAGLAAGLIAAAVVVLAATAVTVVHARSAGNRPAAA
jgi:hypothetical protein